jgi:protein-disulfide isomerase
VAWRDFPLEFHQNAKPAAMAARAAGEQGKFWEMHGKLFGNQQRLDRPSLEKYASELGLNMSKFKAALDSNKYGSDIEADMKAGQAVGVSGTPRRSSTAARSRAPAHRRASRRWSTRSWPRSRKGS